MTVPLKKQGTVAKLFTTECDVHAFVCDWELAPAFRMLRWFAEGESLSDSRTVYFLTTDLDSGRAAQDQASAFGFEVQILFPRDALPTSGRGLLIALDELLLDARGRREYLAQLRTQSLRMPAIVLSCDFLGDPPAMLRPGLLRAATLSEAVWRALRDGDIHLPDPDGERESRRAA